MTETLNLEQVYIWISLFSTILFILKTIVFILLGGDSEVISDFDSISDTDTSFSFVSVQTILAFFMGFGWMGLTAINQMKLSTTLVIITSFLTGLIFMVTTAYLISLIRKLNQSTKFDISECIGKEGKTYQDIDAQAEGQIEIVINKKLTIVKAFNANNEKINAFTPIKIEKVENNKLYISKI